MLPAIWWLNCPQVLRKWRTSMPQKMILNHFSSSDQSASICGSTAAQVLPYLIFVIFFTQAKFLENKIYTEKRVNFDKLHSKLPILRVNYDKLHSKLPLFRVKSVKIYTGKKKFTRAPLVVLVTNMRYAKKRIFNKLTEMR